MKKIIIGAVVAIAAVIGIYMVASPKITGDIKEIVNQEMTALNQHGFSVSVEPLAEDRDRFTISFDDTQKIGAFVTAQTSQVSQPTIDMLEGMEIVAEVAYAQGITNALSMDIYPTKAPALFTDTNSTDMPWIEDMINKKVVSLSMEVDKTLSNFKGAIKDIDYTTTDENSVRLSLKGSAFEGKLKEKQISTINHKLESLSIADTQAALELFDINIQGMTTGPNPYDADQKGNIGKISFKDTTASNSFAITNLDFDSSTSVADKLLRGGVALTIDQFQIESANDKGGFSGVAFDLKLQNIDIDSINTINALAQSEDNEAIMEASKAVLSSNPKITIDNFSIKEIVDNNQTFKGLVANANLAIDESVDINKAFDGDKEAFGRLFVVDAKLNFSKEALEFFAQDPSIGMLTMLVAPEESNAELIYTIKYHNGLTVNGQKLF